MPPQDPYAAVATSDDPYAPIAQKNGANLPADRTGQDTTVVKPPTWGGVVKGIPDFLKQTGEAAVKDVKDVAAAVTPKVKETMTELKQDPTLIVPLWFGAGMSILSSAGRGVAEPIGDALKGDEWDAASKAAGGDPDAARRYRDEGNAGGEFWEMAGRPIVMLGAGKALGLIGGSVAEGSDVAGTRIVRSIMADSGGLRSGIPIEDANLAREALQDAAREEYGTGPAGQKALKKALPTRERSIADLLSGQPLTESAVEAGNRQALNLMKKAVDIAGQPADKINAVYGYIDGRQAAQGVYHDLEEEARWADSQGLNTYAKALRDRAKAVSGKKTLGELYDLKKSANKLADVSRNTQEAIDLMDSWSALAGSVRRNVYPVYEDLVTKSGTPGFSLAAAGKKEGAAMMLRNGYEKRWLTAQKVTDELHTPGHLTEMGARGAPEHRLKVAAVVRAGQKSGILPQETGYLNKAVRKGVGKLSSDTRPASLNVTQPAKFSAGTLGSMKQLPGATFSFNIPTTPGVEEALGDLLQPAAKAQRHAYEDPHYLTSTRPKPREVGPKGVRTEGSTGADIETATTQEPRQDIVRGGGVLKTADLKTAVGIRDRLKDFMNSRYFKVMRPEKQQQVREALANIEDQVRQYQAGHGGSSRVEHTPAKMEYSPRSTGNVPVRHPARRALPAILSSTERESQDQ